MKPDYDYFIDKEKLLFDLNQLDFISSFIMYEKFNLSKKKLKNKLKKLIQHIENDKSEKYLELEKLNQDE